MNKTNQVFSPEELIRKAVGPIFASLHREVAGLRAALEDFPERIGESLEALGKAEERLAKLECQSAISANPTLKIQS